MEATGSLSRGLIWSFVERFSVIGFQMGLEIILARLLLPSDYGILGMITIVVAFGNVFIDGGFSSALIHYKDRNEQDFSTVFYISLFIGIIIYSILYVFSPNISLFFNKDLTVLIRFLGINILFNAFGVIYRAKLSISLNFKKQTIYSFISIILSGIIGVYCAYSGFGVWALVYQMVGFSFLYNFFLFLNFREIPKLYFSIVSFRRIFGFGSKVLISSLIQSVYFNTYPLVLGKVYNAKTVGLYTKANQFTIFPAGVFTNVVQRVLFPYMVNFQNDKKKIYLFNQKFVKYFSIFCFPIVVLIVIFAKPLLLTILSETWVDMVIPFQILLICSVFFPIIIFNMNVFQVIGKSNYFLYLEIGTKIIGIIILILTYKFGFIYVCYGILLQIILQFILTSVFSSYVLLEPLYRQFFLVGKIFLANVILLVFGIWLRSIFENIYFSTLIIILSLSSSYFLFLYLFYKKNMIELIVYLKLKVLKQ